MAKGLPKIAGGKSGEGERLSVERLGVKVKVRPGKGIGGNSGEGEGLGIKVEVALREILDVDARGMCSDGRSRCESFRFLE